MTRSVSECDVVLIEPSACGGVFDAEALEQKDAVEAISQGAEQGGFPLETDVVAVVQVGTVVEGPVELDHGVGHSTELSQGLLLLCADVVSTGHARRR